MKKAVIYARVSTEDQAEGASLDNQVEVCRKYCSEKGYTVLGEFREDISGAELNRPVLDQIIEIADSFNVLVVYSVDRFARELEVHYVLEKEIKDQGATLEFALGNFSDTPEGNLYRNMTIAFAQFERAQILRRTVGGLQARAKSGKVTHAKTPPYGYDYKDGYFVINEQQAEVVREIYNLYINHKIGARKIAQTLTDQNIPTSYDLYGFKKQSKGWGASTIIKILKNTVYYGETTYGDIKIDAPPIIDKKTFLRAQQQRKDNKHFAKRNTKHKYLLQGRLYCAVCGGKMYGVTSSRGHKYYNCNNQFDRKQSFQYCGGVVSVDKIDDRAWAYVKDVIINTKYYIDEWRKAQDSGEYESTGQTIKRNQEHIADLEDQRARLLPLFQKGLFSEDQLTKEVSQINEQILDLEQAIKELSNSIDISILDMEESEFINKWRDLVTGLGFEDKQKIISILNIKAYALRLGDGETFLQLEGNYEGLPLYYSDQGPGEL